MTNHRRDVLSYEECYRAQFGAIGRIAQESLRHASVLIVGTGGLGTAVSMALATAGVGRLILVDPQRVAPDNLNRNPSLHPRDVGRWKVDVLASGLAGRPFLTTVPVIARAEHLASVGEARTVDLVVATCNSVSSRIAAAQFACRRSFPQVSAALTDGRERLGGLIVAWAGGRHRLACPACFLTARSGLPRGEALVWPLVTTVGGVAAWFAIRILLAPRRHDLLESGNCLTLDLDHHILESLRVRRRSDCSACVHISRRLSGRTRR
jgi:ThiF family